MGGCVDTKELDHERAAEQLAQSMERAREGDRETLRAFKLLEVDIRREESSAKELLPQLLERGERLDEKEGDFVVRTLLGDVERLG